MYAMQNVSYYHPHYHSHPAHLGPGGAYKPPLSIYQRKYSEPYQRRMAHIHALPQQYADQPSLQHEGRRQHSTPDIYSSRDMRTDAENVNVSQRRGDPSPQHRYDHTHPHAGLGGGGYQEHGDAYHQGHGLSRDDGRRDAGQHRREEELRHQHHHPLQGPDGFGHPPHGDSRRPRDGEYGGYPSVASPREEPTAYERDANMPHQQDISSQRYPQTFNTGHHGHDNMAYNNNEEDAHFNRRYEPNPRRHHRDRRHGGSRWRPESSLDAMVPAPYPHSSIRRRRLTRYDEEDPQQMWSVIQQEGELILPSQFERTGGDSYQHFTNLGLHERHLLMEEDRRRKEEAERHDGRPETPEQQPRVSLTELVRSAREMSGEEMKRKQRRTWTRVVDVLSYLEPWRGAIKRIEGRFGVSVGSYFRFLRWMLYLDVLLAAILLLVLLVPQVALAPYDFRDTFSGNVSCTADMTMDTMAMDADMITRENGTVVSLRSGSAMHACECSNEYSDISAQLSHHNISEIYMYILDFFQATGWMENTILFQGFYFNKTYVDMLAGGETAGYNMPLAYLLSIAAFFMISLILMVVQTASGMKHRLIHGGEKFYHYSNIVLCGWDYSLTSRKHTAKHHRNLMKEIKYDLAEQREAKKRASRSRLRMCCLVFTRICVNLIVVGFLIASGMAIYYTIILTNTITETSTDGTNTADVTTPATASDNATGAPGAEAVVAQSTLHPALVWVFNYLPSLTITVLNIIVPKIFVQLAKLEDYTPHFTLKITLVRMVFLRLASVFFLIGTLAVRIVDCDKNACGSCKNQNIRCWETYIGQQIYQLVLLDFIVVFLNTFLVEFPRKMIERSCSDCLLVKLIGQQEFDIPKNVLDLVYSQTLCWLGGYFSPLIPAISVIKMFFIFYMKMISVLKNCVASLRPYRASKASTFFTAILMCSYVVCVIAVGFVIGMIPPSKGCSPFRVYSKPDTEYVMFTALTDRIAQWEATPRQMFFFLAHPVFYLAVIVLLCLAIFYNLAKRTGHKKKIKLLKRELILTGRDKQYLFGRVKKLLATA